MINANRELWNLEEKRFQMKGNVKVVAAKKQEILDELRFRLATQMKTRIFFLNAFRYRIAQKNAGYERNLNAAEFVLHEGIGLDFGALALNISLKEQLNEIDFTAEVLKILNHQKMSLYLLGGRPGVADVAAYRIQQEFPDIILSGTCHGSFENPVDVLRDINRVKPDLLLVGMEVPLQENWISANFEELDATLMMAVGSYLDIASGRIAKAPALIGKIRLGWAYRLFQERNS